MVNLLSSLCIENNLYCQTKYVYKTIDLECTHIHVHNGDNPLPSPIMTHTSTAHYRISSDTTSIISLRALRANKHTPFNIGLLKLLLLHPRTMGQTNTRM